MEHQAMLIKSIECFYCVVYPHKHISKVIKTMRLTNFNVRNMSILYLEAM